MQNRRQGGMGPNRGNRQSYSQGGGGYSQNSVSPWQGGVSNNMNSGLLNQLSNPQQLALALSNLLQPQQQQHQPSLLSLNTSPAFSNQDRNDRFGHRGRLSDFRRHEPYNKNRQGGGGGGGGNWGRDRNRNQNRNRNDNKGRNQSQKKDDVKKEEKKDDANTTAEGEETETKRDWKEEKNTGDDAQKNGEADTKDADAKDGDPKAGVYKGVPQHLLRCFVCAKDMWDGESFQKHIRGRAHKQMLDSVEESFQITVNILRENMRLAEEKKLIELNRMQRLNKNRNRKYNEVESHCNMCDFKFLGKIMTHRKSEGHQRLKRFLHPDCKICSKEFPSRMDWVDHRLTPEHLRGLAKSLETQNDGDTIVDVKEEDLELDLQPIMDETTEMEDQFPILELDDDLSNLQNRTPAFRRTRAVGTKALQAFTGFQCSICHKSFTTDELAQAHLKSRNHYYKFVEAAKKKFQEQEDEKKAAERKEAADKKSKEEKDKKDKDGATEKEEDDDSKMETSQEDATLNDSEMYDPEEPSSQDDTQNESQVSQEDEAEAAEEEEEKKEEVESPSRPKRGGAVKNGAGPRSKRGRGK